MMSMWVAGITQGLMWRQIDAGGRLVYPNFIETVVKIVPMYWVRAFGGVLVLAGFIIMVYNLIMTIKLAKKDDTEEVFAAAPLNSSSEEPNATAHRKLEGLPILFTALTALAILVGGAVEIIPSLLSNNFVEKNPNVKPYTPLELAGRDIYIAEGCYVCHSQQIRPTPEENLRYGKPSTAADSVYDRPFQWGSRRIGPDLARVGGKYNDMWHYRHMMNPRDVTPKSIMPNYTWLFKKKTDFASIEKKVKVMKALGVPYSDEEIRRAYDLAQNQANEITKGLVEQGIPSEMKNKQIIALIAYLQRLGIDTADKE